MTATLTDLQDWVLSPNSDAKWVIIVCDTFDNDNYPIYVSSYVDLQKELKWLRTQEWTRVEEVYDLLNGDRSTWWSPYNKVWEV